MTSYTADHCYTASTLDNLRLNKQALEGWQILLTLLELDPDGEYRQPRGWVNHPAVKMWRDHELALYDYILAMVDEWKRRGYKTTIGDKATSTMQVAWENNLLPNHNVDNTPSWMRNKDLLDLIVRSHRQALLCKSYEHYSQFDWAEDTGEPSSHYSYEYVWGVS
jgi:hypothetical protein